MTQEKEKENRERFRKFVEERKSRTREQRKWKQEIVPLLTKRIK